MNDKNFKLICGLLKQQSGIVLEDDKGYLAENRLAPVARQFGHADVDALVANIVATKSRDAVQAVVEAMETNETYFFRDVDPFAHFEQIYMPARLEEASDRKQMRIWSAAASTGQEGCSLAMTPGSEQNYAAWLSQQSSRDRYFRKRIAAGEIW